MKKPVSNMSDEELSTLPRENLEELLSQLKSEINRLDGQQPVSWHVEDTRGEISADIARVELAIGNRH